MINTSSGYHLRSSLAERREMKAFDKIAAAAAAAAVDAAIAHLVPDLGSSIPRRSKLAKH